LLGVVLTAANIDDRKKKELALAQSLAALAASESRFRSSFENAAIGMAIVSLDGEWLQVNRALCNMTGYTTEELKGIRFQQITHPDDVGIDVSSMNKIRKGELDYYRRTKRYLHKNGSVIWIKLNVSLVKDADNTPWYFVAQVEDITERVAYQTKLEQSEANLKSIFETTDVSFLLLDPDLTILALNNYVIENYAYHTGFRLEVGLKFTDYVVPERREFIVNALEGVLATGEPLEYETSFERNGEKRYYTAKFSAVKGDKGIIGLCCTGQDITTRKNMELEKQEMIADLIARNEDLQEFAQIVSHNLRGPIATILGLVDVVHTPLSNADNDVIVAGIKSSAEALDAVIRNLNNMLGKER
jgi:PAS domain S-box-containing protein